MKTSAAARTKEKRPRTPMIAFILWLSSLAVPNPPVFGDRRLEELFSQGS
jgi:hypothetical protein